MHTTHNNGEIAVLKVELEANQKGFIVSYPRNQHSRYDMLIDDGQKIYRTQIKYLNSFQYTATLRWRLPGSNDRYNKPYDKKDIDLLLMYLPIRDCVVSVPVDMFHQKTSLTINISDPSSPNYYKKILW